MHQQKPTLSLPKTQETATHLTQIKLELLKLIYRHDRSPKELCDKAREFEPYLMGKSQDPV